MAAGGVCHNPGSPATDFLRMPTAGSASPQGPTPGPRLGLSRRAWLIAAAGFGIGLLLFLLLWLSTRNDSDFYRAPDRPDGAEGQVFEPLPAPQPDGAHSASGLTEAAEEALRNPRPAPAPPPVAQQAPQTTAPPPAIVTDAPRPTGALAPGDKPVPISRPAPSYPSDALRNGETGTAVVRIEVGADGEPVEVSLVTRTGSRSLDRAALNAARRWKFRPAQRNGQPVPGTVEAPITFSLDR